MAGEKFDVYGLASGIIGSVAGGVIAENAKQGEIKKNEALQKQLQELNEASIKELEQRILAVDTELKRQRVLVEYLSEQKKGKILADVSKKRNMTLLGLGVGVIVLILVLYKLANRNGQRN
jgi:hypothetical protein